jgi:hypothetical protein
MIYVADKNINSLQKTTQKYWKISELCSFKFQPPSWASDAILNLIKNFSSMKYVQLNTSSNQKAERKNVQNSLSNCRKPSF